MKQSPILRAALRKAAALALTSCLALQPMAGQAQIRLPDLGDPSQSDFSPSQERRIGELAMREIRTSDRAYLDDVEVEDYLNAIGARLVQASGLQGQDFFFFALRNPTINAFAMPGGYIGVHSGLIVASQSESELASVLAHEIAHVEQRHIARMLTQQTNASLTMLASLLVAILAANSNSQLSEAAIVSGQAAAIQRQLSYSRDFEREADRVGLQTLEAAGFSTQGMPDFFARLQRVTRLVENNAPDYLRTHPLTGERITDIQGRVKAGASLRASDSTDYLLVRAKLDAENGNPRDAITRIAALPQTRAEESIYRAYGLARAYLRDNRLTEAQSELAKLRADKVNNAMVEKLAADLALAQKKPVEAASICRDARKAFARARSLVYCEARALLAGNQPQQALEVIRWQQTLTPQDERSYALQAQAYSVMGKPAAQHRAQAEFYVQRGNLTAAVDQLQLAQRSGDGDFYEQSAIDARLRELRARLLEEAAEQRAR